MPFMMRVKRPRGIGWRYMPGILADEAPGRSVILGLAGPVVQTRETFHDVDMIMEGLVNLSRRRLQPLLAQAKGGRLDRKYNMTIREDMDAIW
jgi:hypothetical protein